MRREDDMREEVRPRRPAASVRSTKDAPVGGSRSTEEELSADNAAEEDTLRALDGESPSG